MAEMTTLTELSRRVSEAEGPSRELDAAVWDALNEDGCRIFPASPNFVPSDWLPHYTASLDAVEALRAEKLPGTHILVAVGPTRSVANVSERGLGQFNNHWYPQGKGATETLARLAAALLAIHERNKRCENV